MELLEEWDYEKNKGISIDDITFRSGKKVWWKCKNGHRWEALVCNRTRKRGCPYCSNRKLIKGVNDLQTKYPDIASEWHPEKNIGLSPSDFIAGANKKAWWKCERGHEWEATLCNRTANKTGCKQCRKEGFKKKKS